MNERKKLKTLGELGTYAAMDTRLCKWADEHITELEQQLAAAHLIVEQRHEELASCMRVSSNKFDTIQRLNKELANATKQNVMLRDAVEELLSSIDQGLPKEHIAYKALAATADLVGLILCDAEPVWYEITARDGTQYALTTQPVLLGHTSEPLYKAKEKS